MPLPRPDMTFYRCPSGCVILGIGRTSLHLSRDEFRELRRTLEQATGTASPSRRTRATTRRSQVRLATRDDGDTRLLIGGVALTLGPFELLELAGAIHGLAAEREPALAN